MALTRITAFHNGVQRQVVLVILGLALLSHAVPGKADQIKLAWDANIQAILGGYQLHYGQASGSYTASVDVGNKPSYTLTGLQDGKNYYVAVKAYSIGGLIQSGFSNEVGATTAVSPPPTAACPCSLWGSASTPAIAS